MKSGLVSGKRNPLVDQWGKIQSAIAQVTGLSYTTLGRGESVVAEAGDLSLCRLVDRARNGGRKCSDTCFAETERARREKAIRYFRCGAGLECFAAPIVVGGRAAAVILGGRALEKAPDPEFFQGLARERGLPEDEVLKAVGRLPLENARSLARTAEMVKGIAEVLFTSLHHQSHAQKRLALLTSLFQLGSDLSPDKDPHEIYALIVNTVSILFDAEGAALFLLHPDSGRFRLKTAFGTAQAHLMKLELHDGMPAVGNVLESRTPFVSSDYHLLLRSGFPEQVRSAALFPLLFGEEVRGLLLLVNTPIDADGRRMIYSFANQASTAIQNTLLRQELKAKVEEAHRLIRVQNRLSSVLDRDALLETIFEEALGMTRAEEASLMVLNRKTSELVVRLARGEHSPVIRQVALAPGEGLAGKVAARGEPLLVSDIEMDPRFGRRRRPRYRSNSFLLVPITVEGRVIGVINLADKAEGIFTSEDLDNLKGVLGQASIALQRSELFAMTKELQKISTTDPLTQLLNRRYFQKRSREEILRAQRYNSPLSLVMLDLDDFKRHNDQFGHLAGDDLLVGVSQVLREAVRSIDVVSRFGGEEFAILSPQTTSLEALTVADRVREAVRRRPFELGRNHGLGTVSISAGVASFPEQAGSLQELIDNADRALYRAKRAGKDRVVLFG